MAQIQWASTWASLTTTSVSFVFYLPGLFTAGHEIWQGYSSTLDEHPIQVWDQSNQIWSYWSPLNSLISLSSDFTLISSALLYSWDLYRWTWNLAYMVLYHRQELSPETRFDRWDLIVLEHSEYLSTYLLSQPIKFKCWNLTDRDFEISGWCLDSSLRVPRYIILDVLSGNSIHFFLF